jgi:Zn-dependent alcohol dehydrogenase
MSRIRAAVSRQVKQPLSIEEVELEAPRPDEVRVELGAVAVCHSDIAFIDDDWEATLPAVWGHEAAGEVVEVGEDAGAVKIGDRVVVTSIRRCGSCRNCRRGLSVACTTTFPRDAESPLRSVDGEPITHGLRMAAFAEEVVVHHTQVATVPTTVPVESAALLGCGVISGFGAAVNTAPVDEGSTVVVIGAGGVGLHTVQGARFRRAGAIVAVDISDQKLEWAKRLGATHLVNPATSDLATAVVDVTGDGADYVFVATGAKAAIDAALPLVAAGGTLVLVGMPPTGTMIEFDPGTFAGLNQTVLGSKLGSTTLADDIPLLVDLYQRNELELDGLIGDRYPIEEINQAVDAARAGNSVRNVVTFDR